LLADDSGYKVPNGGFVAHDGGVAGYAAQIVFHPESRTGVALLRNYGGGRTNTQKAAEILLAELVAPTR